VGGIPELLTDGIDALLVPEKDSSSLAAALAKLLQNPTQRQQLGAAAREATSAYDWQTIASRYAALYDQALLSDGSES